MLTEVHNAKSRVEFNPHTLKEVEEAKKKYQQARAAGRKITDMEGNPVSVFKPSLEGFIIEEAELKEDEIFMRIFDETGDTRLIWNMKDPGQIKDAAKKFDEYIKKGWRAYAVDRNGDKTRRIFSFDVEKQEILFEEKGIAEKLSKFVKSFKEVKLMPKTMPG